MQTGVSYYGNRILRHVQADLEAMAANGCTFVVHTFSESDLLFHRQTMKAIVAATHAAGLKAWLDPWAFGGVFGGEALSLYVARFPEHQQVLVSGERVPAACPNRFEFRAALREWVDAALDCGADALLWDEPHFYAPGQAGWRKSPGERWACHCDACQYLYDSRYGEALPATLDVSARAFRQERILDFLADMSGYAASRGALNALCLPLPPDEPSARLFRAAADLPNIHIFGAKLFWLQTYVTVEEHVGQQTARLVDLCRYLNKPAQVWVQAFDIPEGREEDVATAVEIAAAAGAEYVAAWSYPLCEPIGPNASPRPEFDWDALGRAFRQARK